MIFVVLEELIPSAQLEGNTNLVTISALFRIGIMMTLDVALG